MYILAVDGGNSKTDFCVFGENGKFVAHKRTGTCSHEILGYAGAREEIKKAVSALLGECHIEISDIDAAVFGIAGVDMPVQQENMCSIIKDFGFKRFVVENDGFLGLKAGSAGGVGICSINGTGTVVVGSDNHGNRLQVGGIGFFYGDEAGGSFISRLAIKAGYNYLYRNGPKTMLAEALMKYFNISDKIFYLQTTVMEFMEKKADHTPVIKILYKCAADGDLVANNILKHVGAETAKSVIGCYKGLSFENELEVIAAGSVWVKSESPVAFDTFKEEIAKAVDIPVSFKKLEARPVAGAVLWAYELALNEFPPREFKENIISQVLANID